MIPIEKLIDALCIISVTPTDNGYEKHLYRESKQLIETRVIYLNLLKEREVIENKLSAYNELI